MGRLFKEHGDAPELLEYIDWLSIPIATEINIFDPDYIVLGGGVLQMEAFPQKLLEKRILEHTRKPYPAANLSVLYSSPHQENGVIGAGIYALRRLADLPIADLFPVATFSLPPKNGPLYGGPFFFLQKKSAQNLGRFFCSFYDKVNFGSFSLCGPSVPGGCVLLTVPGRPDSA